jgi:hypothetical protein
MTKARRGSCCPVCHKTITPGEEIAWHRLGYVHRACRFKAAAAWEREQLARRKDLDYTP